MKSVSRGKEMIMAEDVGAKTVVLVHGGFVDGSGWEGVYNILRKDGYTVAVVQNPTISLADDVAVTKRVIDAQTGPVVLVGHSYGGGGVTPAGDTPRTVRAVLNYPRSARQRRVGSYLAYS